MKRLALVPLALLLSAPALAADNDGDGVPNHLDNCIQESDTGSAGVQVDSDGDGYGNLCDPDFNQDGIVGGPDLAIFRAHFGEAPPSDPAIDLNSDGVIGSPDLVYVSYRLRLPPGPAAFNRPVPALPAVFMGMLVVGMLAVGRRIRRRRGRGGLSLGVLLLALLAGGRAEAGGTLSFVWTATTGTGTPGTSFIRAQPGDLLTGELRIQPDAGAVVFASASLRFDADLFDELDLVGVTFPPFQLIDGVPMVPLFSGPASTTESSDATGGEILACDIRGNLAGPPNPTVTEFVICEVQFQATANVVADGPDIDVGLFFTGYDSINDEANNAQTSLPVPVQAGVDRFAGDGP